VSFNPFVPVYREKLHVIISYNDDIALTAPKNLYDDQGLKLYSSASESQVEETIYQAYQLSDHSYPYFHA